MKRNLNFILLFLLLLIFSSCSNIVQDNKSDSSSNPWTGNWYGYIGEHTSEHFYKLTFNGNTACLFYTSNTGYKPLYETAAYEYTTKNFNITFTHSSYGTALDKNMEIYGTMISGRDDGFYLWNSTDRPFFKLD
ncbi:MAG: hypothetical protein IJP90_11970 [Treponema sp.]|nr:hypothetical protein [Treponema sp.]